MVVELVSVPAPLHPDHWNQLSAGHVRGGASFPAPSKKHSQLSVALRHQLGFRASVQTMNIYIAFDGNMGHGHKHRHWLKLDDRPRHGPQQQLVLEVTLASGGSTGLSHQAVPYISASLHRAQTTLLLSYLSTTYFLVYAKPATEGCFIVANTPAGRLDGPRVGVL